MTPQYPTIQAVAILSHTLVGVGGNPPYQHGNCFSVKADDGQSYRIVNFVYENLPHLPVSLPIKIHVLGPNVAVIHDERIPAQWYSPRFCDICCPDELLPITQLLMHARHVLSGRRQENESGTVIRFDVA